MGCKLCDSSEDRYRVAARRYDLDEEPGKEYHVCRRCHRYDWLEWGDTPPVADSGVP